MLGQILQLCWYFKSFGDDKKSFQRQNRPGVSALQRQILITTLIIHKLDLTS